MAVLSAAVAVVVPRPRAFPAWLGWLSAVSAVCSATLVCSLVAPVGPLPPQGSVSYLPYVVRVIWLVATPTRMILDATRGGGSGQHRGTGRPAESGTRVTITG